MRHRTGVGRGKARPHPSVQPGSKRGHRDGGVDFADGLDDPKQVRPTQLQLTAGEIQRVCVHDEQHVQEFHDDEREGIRGERIAADPARDTAETRKSNEVGPERSGDRRRLVRANRRQLERRGEQRTHLPEPRDLSHGTACGHDADRQVHDVTSRPREQQLRHEVRQRHTHQGHRGPHREHDVPSPPVERVRPGETMHVVGSRRPQPCQQRLGALASSGVICHASHDRVEGVQSARRWRRAQPVVEHLLTAAAFGSIQMREHVIQQEVGPRAVVKERARAVARTEQVRHGVHVSRDLATMTPLGTNSSQQAGSCTPGRPRRRHEQQQKDHQTEEHGRDHVAFSLDMMHSERNTR